MIRVFLSGQHAQRTPLSYPALAPLFADAITLTDRHAEADIYLFAHSLDVEAAPDDLIQDWRVRRPPVVILSEEPFWDTIWGRRPLSAQRVLETALGEVPVVQVNHQTSELFAFDRIPYYLLTNHRFANAYISRFRRNAGQSPEQWKAAFAGYPVDLAFMFERRPEPFHSCHWPEAHLIGLCAWRTEVAETCAAGVIERLGKSWQGGKARSALPNWHLDKLTRLDRRARVLAAIENTHQPQYLTEKPFDAYACGSIPAYFASDRHRIHDLNLPEGSWINLFGLSPADAAGRLDCVTLDDGFYQAYAEAQQRLSALFGDPAHWVAERARLRDGMITALTQVLDQHQPVRV